MLLEDQKIGPSIHVSGKKNILARELSLSGFKPHGLVRDLLQMRSLLMIRLAGVP